MTTAQTDRTIEEVARSVLDDLSKHRLELSPKAVQARSFVDGLGEDAWQILLVLPRPRGETWDREAVFKARMAAVAEFDRRVAGTPLELPGRTLAVVTTDEATEEDTAVDDPPEKGEDPAVDSADVE